MYILGISALYHDSAAALLHDGALVAAAQEERFSRVKFDHRFPRRSIGYCLAQAGIEPKDLDYVVFYEKPLLKFERILTSQLGTFPRSWRVFREAFVAWAGEKLWIKSTILTHLRLPPDRILFVEHHAAHAASAFFCAPFERAAVLTLDGVGEWTTTAFGHASGAWNKADSNTLILTDEIRFPHSLGLLYSAFTAWLGFKVNSGEYKVMGMAPYGGPRYVDRVERLVRVSPDGSFQLNMNYFSFHYSLTDTFNAHFIRLFGPPREPEAPFFTRTTGHDIAGRETQADRNQYYADVAASVQYVVEEILLKVARHLHARTGLQQLVVAGGVALNSVANGRLMREGPFAQVFIQPNAGDAGGALGAALYARHIILGKPRDLVMEHAYYGQEYLDAEIRAFLEGQGVRYEECHDVGELADRIVDAICQSQVVGLAQGRFEWGPRALGNRSILADPRREAMKELVNTKIKFREPFRPFAPVVTEEAAPRYFEVSKTHKQYPERFMLMVAPVRPERGGDIPAVNHMGTGRLQTVRREWNPLYYEVVRRFGEATGIPVLLNTSFNLRSEPMVASPRDALKTFVESDIDMLVLNRYVVRKSSMGSGRS